MKIRPITPEEWEEYYAEVARLKRLEGAKEEQDTSADSTEDEYDPDVDYSAMATSATEVTPPPIKREEPEEDIEPVDTDEYDPDRDYLTPEDAAEPLDTSQPFNYEEPVAPRDTTFGEKAAGVGLAFGAGTMGATKSVLDLAEVAIPKALEKYTTDPWIDLLQRGMDAADALTPEAFKAKQAEGFLRRSEVTGKAKGLQLPSVEHATAMIAQTIPYIPSFIVGGGGTSKALQKLAPKVEKLSTDVLGYGLTNAALQAPSQYEETYNLAKKEGWSEKDAKNAGQVASALVSTLMFVTGGGGGALSASIGAEAKSLVGAITKGFLAEGPFEGVEEGGQSLSIDYAMNRELDTAGALDVSLSGTALGGGPGAGVAALEYRKPYRAGWDMSPPPLAPIPTDDQSALGDLKRSVESPISRDIGSTTVNEKGEIEVIDDITDEGGVQDTVNKEPVSTEELEKPVVKPEVAITDPVTGQPSPDPITGQPAPVTPSTVDNTAAAQTPAEHVLSSGFGRGKSPSALENKLIDNGIKLKEKQITSAQDAGDILAEARHKEDLDALVAEKKVREERAAKTKAAKAVPAPVVAPAALPKAKVTKKVPTKKVPVKKAAPAVAESSQVTEASPTATTNMSGAGTYRDGTGWTSTYNTVRRTDGSHAIERVIHDSDGEKVSHLMEDGVWEAGRAAKTAVSYGGRAHAGSISIASFPTERHALLAAESDLTSMGGAATAPATPTATTTVVTRSKDFSHTGEYEVTTSNGKTARIFRDAGNTNWWYENTPEGVSKSPLGFTKKEAIAEVEAREAAASKAPAKTSPSRTSKKTGKVAVKKAKPIKVEEPAAVAAPPAPRPQEAPIVKTEAAKKARPPITFKDSPEAKAAQPPVEAEEAPSKNRSRANKAPTKKAKESEATPAKTKEELKEETVSKKALNERRLRVVNRKIGDIQRELVHHYDTPLNKRDKAAVAELEKKLAPLKKEQAKLEASDIKSDRSIASTEVGAPVSDVKMSEIKDAVTAALSKHYARLITFVTDSHPKASVAVLGKDGKTRYSRRRAWYDSADGKIYLVVRNDMSAARAIWTAWHELTHRGMDKMFNVAPMRMPVNEVEEFQRLQEEYDTLIDRAFANPTVRKIAQYLIDGTAGRSDAFDKASAVDEAFAEIGAMEASGVYTPVEDSYVQLSGTVVSKGMLTGKDSVLGKLVKAWREFVRKIVRRGGVKGLSDTEVYDLVRKARSLSLKTHSKTVDLPSAERVGAHNSAVSDRKIELEVGEAEEGPKKPPAKGSLQEASLNAQRAARGNTDMLGPGPSVPNAVTSAEAKRLLKIDPTLGVKIGNTIMSDATFVPHAGHFAVMQAYHQKLVKTWSRFGDVAMDMNLSEAEREAALEEYNKAEADVSLYEDRIRLGGGRAGAALQYLQAGFKNDWTEAGLLRAARIRNLGVLSKEQVARIKKHAATIATQIEKLETLSDEGIQEEANREINELLDASINEELTKRALHVAHMAKRAANPTGQFTALTKKEKAATIKRFFDAWEKIKDQDVADINEALGLGKAQDITSVIKLMPKLVNVGAYHIARGAYDFATWVADFANTLGNKIFKQLTEEQVKAIYDRALMSAEEAELAAGSKTVEDIEQELQASQLADDPVSHSEVWRLAKAHRMAGIKGADAIMAATTASINKYFPDITERQVRRAFVKYGRATKPSLNEITKDMAEARTIVRLTESIQRLQEGKPALKTGRGRHKDTEAIAVLKKQLYAEMRRYEQAHSHGVDGRLVGINERRATTLRSKITQLEEQLATGKAPEKGVEVPATPEVEQLRAVVSVLKQRLATQLAANNAEATAAKQEARTLARLKAQLVELQRKIHEKDYTRPHKAPKKEKSKEVRQLLFEIQETKSAYLLDQYLDDQARLGKGTRILKGVARFPTILRAVRTSLDLSSFGRQSAVALAAHPSIAGVVLKQQVLAAMSPAKAFEINSEIMESDWGHRARMAGVFFNDPNSTDPTKQEEAYMDFLFQNADSKSDRQSTTSKVLGKAFKYSGVAASSRAYNTGLNVARYHYFKKLVESFEVPGKAPLSKEELEHLAYWVNRATGRGSLTLRKKEGSGGDTFASFLFFAPRWVQSRFSVLSGMPIWRAPSRRMKLKMASEYLRAAGGMITLIALVASAFALAWPDDDIYVGLDPLSSDFLKIVMGDTRLDLTAGLTQVIVLAARSIMRERRTLDGDTIDLTERDGLMNLIMRFGRSKLAPVPAAIVNTWTEKDFLGRETDASHELATMAVPLSLGEWSAHPTIRNWEVDMDGDWSPLLEEQGLPKALVIQTFFFLGGGGGTFTEDESAPSSGKTNETGMFDSRRGKSIYE